MNCNAADNNIPHYESKVSANTFVRGIVEKFPTKAFFVFSSQVSRAANNTPDPMFSTSRIFICRLLRATRRPLVCILHFFVLLINGVPFVGYGVIFPLCQLKKVNYRCLDGLIII